MKLANFISPCRRGRVVRNSRGREVFVRCGHCPDCAYHKSRRYENMCNLEFNDWTYAYTFTLTYSDDNVPRALLVECPFADDLSELEPHLSLFDVTYRHRYGYKTGLRTSTYRLPEFGVELCRLGVSWSSDTFREFYEKSSIRPKNISDDYFFSNNFAFRYLRKADAQEFIKRLREKIHRLCPAPISFFIAGEYGPQTFRPHFHVILYFNSPRLRTRLKGIVNSCWKFGQVRRFGAVRTASGCSTYVAGYINSFSCLPVFLDHKSICPFVLHSQNFGNKVYQELRDYFYREPHDPYDAVSESVIATSVGFYHHFPSASFNAKIYPRCYGYDTADRRTRELLYSCYNRFRNKYGLDLRCPQLALKVLQNPFDPLCSKFLRALEIDVGSVLSCSKTVLPFFVCSESSSPDAPLDNPFLYCRSSSDSEDFFNLIYDFHGHKFHIVPDFCQSIDVYRQIYHRVVSAFYVSRHFLTFCCRQISPDASYHWWTPDEVLDFIEEYYRLLSQTQLCTQYTMEQEYSDTVFSTDYTLFYPLGHPADFSNLNYKFKYNTSHYIINSNLEKDKIYRDRIKHKELNDANKIFCRH